MALNAYDSTKHHIGLGPVGGSISGFEIMGAFTKLMQRETLGAQVYGGSTDLIGMLPSMSRWNMDDFTGGMYQEDVSKDVAMFSSCTSFVSEPQGRGLISISPLTRHTPFDPQLAGNTTGAAAASAYALNPNIPLGMIRVTNRIYTWFKNGVYRWHLGTGAGLWNGQMSFSTLPGTAGTGETYEIVSVAYEPTDDKLWVLCTTTPTSGVRLACFRRLRTDMTWANYNAELPAPQVSGASNSVQNKAYGFAMTTSSIICQVGNRLFSGPIPKNLSDATVAVSITWTEIGRLPGVWIDHVTYGGRLYILCSDNKKTTSLVAFDGSTIQPICSFPWNFDGQCIIEYAGRLYVGGHGTTLSGADDTAHLYEVTGSSVRLVRDFVLPQQRGHAAPTRINDLVVAGGILWMNCKGAGLIGYDVTSDGLFGGPRYQVPVNPANFDAYKLVAGYGRLWAWGHSDTDYAGATLGQDGLYRISKVGDTVTSYNAQLITSDFSAEIGVKKRLSTLRVMSRYVAANAWVSLDSGQSWTSLTRSNLQTSGVNYLSTFDLSSTIAIEHFRFKIELPLGTDPATIGELVSYSCAFTFLDTGKKAWNFTINGSAEIEGRDGASVMQDVPLTATTLWGWANNATRLSLTDLDGSVYNVHLMSVTESQPVIGPNVSGRPEAFYSVSLLEV